MAGMGALTPRQRASQLLDGNGPRSVAGLCVRYGLFALILLNVATSVLSTVAEMDLAYGALFDAIESASLFIFATEYVLHVWVAPEASFRGGETVWRSRLRWLVSVEGLIDLLAVAPFVLSQLTDVDLRVIVLVRLLRFFKFARYSPGFHSLVEAVRAERHALMACILILASVILISAGFLYLFEHKAQPDKFGSIPEAMWWAVATVTTVGYGDVVPVTLWGRIIGALTMVVGLLMLALPAGIVATAFANIIARQNFVVTGGLIARMPIFAGIDAAVIINLLPSVGTRTYGPDEYIVRRGESVSSLYLIAEGKVDVERGRNRQRLGPGDAFGGRAALAKKSARTETIVKLLILAPLEVNWLLETFPKISTQITELL
ncbi:MAG: cyclic nucleotide-binding protein [Reyranella sp.]|nr:cyclic nucleotide-binding protein [Reyranella sp.]